MATRIVKVHKAKEVKKSTNYVDNKQFLADLIEFKKKYKEDPNTRIPDRIGKCILLICEHLATRGNFASYTYRDEMVEDAIEDCVAAVKNFDPENYSNPYGYFTRIAWFAFLQRIKTEKEENYVKHKSFQNSHLLDSMEVSSELSDKVISEFEDNLEKTSKRKK